MNYDSQEVKGRLEWARYMQRLHAIETHLTEIEYLVQFTSELEPYVKPLRPHLEKLKEEVRRLAEKAPCL